MVNDDSVDSESEESDYYSEELVKPHFSNIASPLPDFNDTTDPLSKPIDFMSTIIYFLSLTSYFIILTFSWKIY